MTTSEIEARISELLRELADQEVETRYLRSEVSNLERAAVLVSATPSANRSTAATAQNTTASNMANGMDNVNVASPGGFESCYDPNDADNNERIRTASALQKKEGRKASGNSALHPYMPEEFLDTLSQKRETLIKSKRDYLDSKAKRQQMEALLERNKASAEALSNDLERFYARAKWRPGSTSVYACPIAIDNENTRLKKQLLEVHEDAQLTRKQLLRQTDIIKELADELEELSTIDEEHFNAQTDLRLKKNELKAVEDEILACKRILQQKEKYYARTADRTKDKEMIRQIDADKRVAQTALVAHKDQARQADAGIRHRALLITLLEERIEIIGEAIRGDASPVNSDASSSAATAANNNTNTSISPADVPRVDVQYVDRIRAEIQKLQRQVSENNLIIDVADSQMEIGEERVRILEKATSHTKTKLDKVKADHADFEAIMSAELEEHRTEVVDKLSYYENINEKLRAEIAEMEALISEYENGGGYTSPSANASFSGARTSISQQSNQNNNNSNAGSSSVPPPPASTASLFNKHAKDSSAVAEPVDDGEDDFRRVPVAPWPPLQNADELYRDAMAAAVYDSRASASYGTAARAKLETTHAPVGEDESILEDDRDANTHEASHGKTVPDEDGSFTLPLAVKSPRSNGEGSFLSTSHADETHPEGVVAPQQAAPANVSASEQFTAALSNAHTNADDHQHAAEGDSNTAAGSRDRSEEEGAPSHSASTTSDPSPIKRGGGKQDDADAHSALDSTAGGANPLASDDATDNKQEDKGVSAPLERAGGEGGMRGMESDSPLHNDGNGTDVLNETATPDVTGAIDTPDGEGAGVEGGGTTYEAIQGFKAFA